MNIKKLPLKILATVVLSSLFLTACDDSRVRVSANVGSHVGGHHGGYLTHTPHRHRVSYNSALGLYVVAGLANTYYDNGNYYRYYNSGWQRSRDYRVWSVLGNSYVPKRLYARHYKKPRYQQPKRVQQPRQQIRRDDRRNDRGRTTRPQRGNSGTHTRWIY
jgi:hypothetical protein